ncbi:MAG: sugar ABC transporter ATP-binding protein, partial [Mesorhizobium sp.]
TNNLGVEETHGVLRFVKEMREAGHSVLLITHNIHHVFEVADRIIVMRRGEIVAEQTVADTDLLTVESLITGADLSALMKRAQ